MNIHGLQLYPKNLAQYNKRIKQDVLTYTTRSTRGSTAEKQLNSQNNTGYWQ